MFNNRLNTVAKFLTSEQKLENGGWDLWCRVADRDEKAMALMSKYCAQDIVTLGAVFKRLMPFINMLPNLNIVRETEEFVCPRCGSSRICKKGVGVNKYYSYQKYWCPDCQGYCSARSDTKEPKT